MLTQFLESLQLLNLIWFMGFAHHIYIIVSLEVAYNLTNINKLGYPNCTYISIWKGILKNRNTEIFQCLFFVDKIHVKSNGCRNLKKCLRLNANNWMEEHFRTMINSTLKNEYQVTINSNHLFRDVNNNLSYEKGLVQSTNCRKHTQNSTLDLKGRNWNETVHHTIECPPAKTAEWNKRNEIEVQH